MGHSFSDKSFPLRAYAVLLPVSREYPPLKDMFPCITHPCATTSLLMPFNLHVLGLPPAFVLSQDQTLIFIPKHLKLSCAQITIFLLNYSKYLYFCVFKQINRNHHKNVSYQFYITFTLSFFVLTEFSSGQG